MNSCMCVCVCIGVKGVMLRWQEHTPVDSEGRSLRKRIPDGRKCLGRALKVRAQTCLRTGGSWAGWSRVSP